MASAQASESMQTQAEAGQVQLTEATRIRMVDLPRGEEKQVLILTSPLRICPLGMLRPVLPHLEFYRASEETVPDGVPRGTVDLVARCSKPQQLLNRLLEMLEREQGMPMTLAADLEMLLEFGVADSQHFEIVALPFEERSFMLYSKFMAHPPDAPAQHAPQRLMIRSVGYDGGSQRMDEHTIGLQAKSVLSACMRTLRIQGKQLPMGSEEEYTRLRNVLLKLEAKQFARLVQLWSMYPQHVGRLARDGQVVEHLVTVAAQDAWPALTNESLVLLPGLQMLATHEDGYLVADRPSSLEEPHVLDYCTARKLFVNTTLKEETVWARLEYFADARTLDAIDFDRCYVTGSAIAAALAEVREANVKDLISVCYAPVQTEASGIERPKLAKFLNHKDTVLSVGEVSEQGEATVTASRPAKGKTMDLQMVPGADLDVCFVGTQEEFDEEAQRLFAKLEELYPHHRLILRRDEKGPDSHNWKVLATNPEYYLSFRQIELFKSSEACWTRYHVPPVRGAYRRRTLDTGETNHQLTVTFQCMLAARTLQIKSVVFAPTRRTSVQDVLLKYVNRGYSLKLPGNAMSVMKTYARVSGKARTNLQSFELILKGYGATYSFVVKRGTPTALLVPHHGPVSLSQK